MAFTRNSVRKLVPEDVSSGSNEDKLKYFRNAVVRHPSMAEARGLFLTLLTPGAGTDIVLLIGPTGVGKSETARLVNIALVDRHEQEMKDDAGFIPVASVEAPVSGESRFSWKIFYTKLGNALQEPLMDRKRASTADDGRWRLRSTVSSVAALRMSVENALIHRKTKALIIDEATHLLHGVSGKRLNEHMDTLKSLSNVSGVTLALIGSYDLFQLLTLSGQLARRSALIHLSRYRQGIEKDERCFRATLMTLEKHMPVYGECHLSKFSEPLHEVTIGCVGILKDTLTRALSMCLSHDGVWKDEYLEQAVLSESQVAAILESTLEQERKLDGATYGTGRKGLLKRSKER